jgi:hypothetical protein
MSTLHRIIRSSLPAICAVALFGACASSAPKAKTPHSESASGSADDVTDETTSTKDKSDISEDNTADDSAASGKSESDSAKGKSDDGKKGTAAPHDDSRTTASIQKIINENRPKFKKCYEDVRKKMQDLKGTVVLELTLDADGKIKKSGVNAEESTIKIKTVTDCIVTVAQGLTYPASSKGLDKDFRYEFGFNNH